MTQFEMAAWAVVLGFAIILIVLISQYAYRTGLRKGEMVKSELERELVAKHNTITRMERSYVELQALTVEFKRSAVLDKEEIDHLKIYLEKRDKELRKERKMVRHLEAEINRLLTKTQ